MKKLLFLVFCYTWAINGNTQNSCNNHNLSKGMYVDNFFKPLDSPDSRADLNRSILGNRFKEDALFFYAEQNKINYLTLYGTRNIFLYKSGHIGQAYYPLLADFIARAAGKGIEIGLAFGEDFKDIADPADYLRQPVTREVIMDVFGPDTVFTAWNTVKGLIDDSPEGQMGINQTIYATGSLMRFIRYAEERQEGPLESSPGLTSLVTEIEWWNSSDPESAFRDALIPTLKLMWAVKNAGKIKRVEVYQGRFPGGSLTQHQSWVERMTEPQEVITVPPTVPPAYSPLVDRILLVNYEKEKELIGEASMVRYQIFLFNSPSNRNPNLQLTPLFSTLSDDFYRESRGETYSDHLGKLLSNGAGSSMQEIQTQFRTVYTRMSTPVPDSAGMFFKLAGFHWFTYSLAPLMIYNKDPQINKYRPDHTVTDILRHYFPTGTAGATVDLHVYNAERADFNPGGTPGNLYNNTYSWYRINDDFSGTPTLVSSGSTNSITASQNGMYYIKTTKASCTTVSVPVLVNFTNADVHMRDFQADNGSEPNTVSGDLWASPDIWVNQNPDKNDLNHTEPRRSRMNYVHVRIHNKGPVPTSGREQLNIYYSHASTGLKWPQSWMRVSSDGGIIGDRINRQQTYVPVIAPYSSDVVVIPWEIDEDELPVQGEASDYSRHFCLLARIERSENPGNYGMTHKEGEHLPTNVRENNAIIWRNVTVLNLSPPPPGPTETPMGWDVHKLRVENTNIAGTTLKLEFEKPTTGALNLNDHGGLKINLGPELYNRWVDGGMQGEGITVSSFNILAQRLDGMIQADLEALITTITITGEHAWIGNIALDVDQSEEILVGFKMAASAPEGQYGFVIRQYEATALNPETLTGGESYEVNYRTCPPPVITQSSAQGANVLVCSSVSTEPVTGYQWYKDGLPIAGATGVSYNVSEDGSYTCRVDYLSSCSNTSASVYISNSIVAHSPGMGALTTGDDGLPGTEYIVYPTPASDKLTVLHTRQESFSVEMYDLYGRKVNITETPEKERMVLDVSGLANGRYLLTITGPGTRVNRLISIQHQ